jgi:hypothetical protein
MIRHVKLTSTRLFLMLALLVPVLAFFVSHPAPARASLTQVDSTVIGWDGDKDAAIAHENGSFDIRAGKNITASFGIAQNMSQLEWSNANGYLPALITQFERGNCTITITNFGDEVTIGDNAFVAVYSRITVFNHDTVSHTEDPAPSSGLLALNSVSNTVAAGQTVNHDYVIAVDKFGNSYAWPVDSDLINAGGWDTHFTHMQTYWDTKLAGITVLNQLPDTRLINAYKAGYIYTNIVKDGNNLNVGENGYDQLFDHDLIGILVNLLNEGDFSNAQAYLGTLITNQYPDATYKYSWPWAVYLLKTGDTQYVSSHFATIQAKAHAIQTDATGPNGIMMASNAIDTNGYWTVDDESALLGLLAYGYIAQRLGNTSEATWASQEYTALLNAVNTEVSSTINSNGLSYIPCAMNQPDSANRCATVNDANWASMFLFGRWAWDGYLFNGSQSGPLIDLIDQTYVYGFGRLQGQLPPHTYGGYPGYSTAYNAGYGSAGLRGSRYRSEGIYDYEFMITNTMSAPFSWWENIPSVGQTVWSPNTHATSGGGASPHMWGQANASKVLLDSFIAEKIDGSLIIGRGVPDEWLRSGQTIQLSNYPIANNHRAGMKITTSGNQVTLTLSGDTPTGNILWSLPIFQNNISATSAGTVNSSQGIVTLPGSTTSVTVTLTNAPTFTTLGGLDLNGYCHAIGDIGGVSLDGTTVYDWHCVDSHGQHVSLDMNNACAWQYPTSPSALSQYGNVNNPNTWSCYKYPAA